MEQLCGPTMASFFLLGPGADNIPRSRALAEFTSSLSLARHLFISKVVLTLVEQIFTQVRIILNLLSMSSAADEVLQTQLLSGFSRRSTLTLGIP